jgi:hypothetical protein
MKYLLKSVWPQFLILPVLGAGSFVVDSHRLRVAVFAVMAASDQAAFSVGRPFLVSRYRLATFD